MIKSTSKTKSWIRNLTLASFSTLIGLGLAWFIAPDNIKDKLSDPFSRNPFMMGYDSKIFEGDNQLGFKFPDGKLVSSDGFVTLEETLEELENDDLVFLNTGDSSTSGWNSNKVYKGQKDPTAAFFTYKTYSQLLEEQLEAIVINAGVPGYTSFQGKKYLDKLLKEITAKRIKVDYVTIYFGNNDSTYNQIEDKVILDGEGPSERNDERYRVTREDFKKNLLDMVKLTKKYGAKPVLIKPPVHYDWEPGVRSGLHREELKEALEEVRDLDVGNRLLKAMVEHHRGNYQQAVELDQVLPRIKKRYLVVLEEVARETGTPLIDIQEQIPLTDNDQYFTDYCHPRKKVNQMIVDQLLRIIHF